MGWCIRCLAVLWVAMTVCDRLRATNTRVLFQTDSSIFREVVVFIYGEEVITNDEEDDGEARKGMRKGLRKGLACGNGRRRTNKRRDIGNGKRVPCRNI